MISKTAVILTCLLSGLSYGSDLSIEQHLRSSQGLMTLVSEFEASVKSKCVYAEDASSYYEYDGDKGRSLVGVFECGALRTSPFVRVTGSVNENNQFELFKAVFANR